jgi:hypothetical protein
VLDGELNLPKDSYSHGLRERLASEVARGSFDEAVRAIETTTQRSGSYSNDSTSTCLRNRPCGSPRPASSCTDAIEPVCSVDLSVRR